MHGTGNIELFAAASSRDEPYTVEVVPDGDKVSVFCNCPAGNLTRFCKHKFGIVAGDSRVLDNPDGQREAWNAAQALLAPTGLREAVEKLAAALKNSAVSKDKIKSMKVSVARKMAYGG